MPGVDDDRPRLLPGRVVDPVAAEIGVESMMPKSGNRFSDDIVL